MLCPFADSGKWGRSTPMASHSTQTPDNATNQDPLEVQPLEAQPLEVQGGEISPDAVAQDAVAPEIAADYSVPQTKLEEFQTSKWRPIAVFAGALLIGALLMPLIINRGDNRSAPVAVSSWELALPASSTMMTELSAAPGAPIRGQVSPVADITGKAPVGGAVARWVVQPGMSVQAGQRVVQISSGAASAAPLPGESLQIKAEQQQTAAADDQLDLSKQLTVTQQKLAAAQARVESAQTNIATTRDLIAKLRAGGAEIPAPAPAPRRKTVRPGANIAAARAATKVAQSGFDSTKAQLDGARADLSAAQKSLAPLQSKLDDAQKNVTSIEAKFDGSLVSGSDVQAARSARDSAKSTLKAATSRLESAQKQIPTLERQLSSRESDAEDAKRAERAISAAAPADDNTTDAPAPVAVVSGKTGAMSVENATQKVDAALAESRAATREADRLHALVDLYQAKAQRSNQRITTATEQLKNAQQTSQTRMVQAVPRVRFTAATAPASGVIVWIASLAREVGAGQSVFGMSSGKKYQARFEDRTGGWKNARVGQIVNALLAPPAPAAALASAPDSAVQAPSKGQAGSPPMPVLVSPAPAITSGAVQSIAASAPSAELSGNNAAAQGAIPVKVRLTRIAPPERAGEPAVLEGELVGGAQTAGPQYRLLASLPSVGAPSILTVPDSALVQRDGAWLVAVIEPDKNAGEPQTEVTPTPANSGKAATPAATPAAASVGDSAGTLAWRQVQVGAGDGIARRVNSGLKAGERIITDPLPLIAQAPPESKVMPRVKLG